MQLQLSLKIADRLHQHLLVQGEPIDPAQAATVLLGEGSGGTLPVAALAALDTLIINDERFCWTDSARHSVGLWSWSADDQELLTIPFVALDLETTGARAGVGKITEIGAVRLEGLEVVEEFHTLVNPQRPIPPMIRHITGITEKMVADAPRIEEVMPGLMGLLDGAVVVAHNAAFDVGFLNYELHRLWSLRLGEGAIDTLPLSRALVPGLTNYRLNTVAESLGSPVAACHRALADAQAVAHVFVHLVRLLQDQGVTTLKGLRDSHRSSPRSALQKLPLTRDLPESPGVFTFLGPDESMLLIDGTEDLAGYVRSLFCDGAKRQKGLRTALELVTRVDHEGSVTPLEAIVRAHDLTLKHRPPYGPYSAAPEKYAYIKAGRVGHSLALSTTTRAPRCLREPGNRADRGEEMIIGPFRRRSSARAAVKLLQDCYPIRRCPRGRPTGPCVRGDAGGCVSPCTGAPDARLANDTMVTALMLWLAGQGLSSRIPDPMALADTSNRRQHLMTVRRAYDSLLEARRLCFVLLWPYHTDGGRTVRVNLVIRGMMISAVSLRPKHLETWLANTMDPLCVSQDKEATSPRAPSDSLIAVPAEDVDHLLAVRRWFRSYPSAGPRESAIFSWRENEPASFAEAWTSITAASRSSFGR